MTGLELPDYVLRNRAYWDEVNAPLYAEPGRRAWTRPEFTWGMFQVPESKLRALPGDLAGRDVIELGCGTAYICAWLARDRLLRPYFGMHRFEWPDEPGVEWARRYPAEEIWRATKRS